MIDLEHFKPNEVEGLNESTAKKLDYARGTAGVPFVITSGFRTSEKNKGLSGAVGDSSHLSGHGVDLHVEDDFHFKAVVAGLLAAGFNRMGFYFALEGTKLIPKHIHVDDDPTKPAHVFWSLIEQN